ncbi:hypothetical protein V8G54_031177 [Vigna mungo]|uniref:Thioredoxin-like protein 4B n=1 Tax=Vigna mungo TaxID=3915 RepID=A0AAQ3RLY0_VIGMU
MSELLTTLSKKIEVDTIIRDTFDKVVVLRFGRASDLTCLQQDHILSKAARDVSKFATVALVDVDSEDIQAIFRGAMKGKLIVNSPLPPERIPKFQILYKDV